MGLTSPLKPVTWRQQLDVSQVGSIRDGFGHGLVAAMKNDARIVAVCADVTESIRMQYAEQTFPDRMVQVGVAEQNLVGVSAGLALSGLIPMAGSYAVFSPGRSWDQLRVSVCYSNLNVKIIGGHGGLSVGPDGASHQALEDIAITRVLPNLVVIVPADELEAERATLALAQHVGPVYLRLSREKSPLLTTPETPFEIGKANVLQTGKHVTIVACGLMVAEALKAAALLTKSDISATVINMHTIKPLDVPTLVKAARITQAVVTVEEHQIMGGLGSAVAEALSQQYPVPVEMVGVKDTFGESGTAADLFKKYGLTANHITKAVWRVLARKSNS